MITQPLAFDDLSVHNRSSDLLISTDADFTFPTVHPVYTATGYFALRAVDEENTLGGPVRPLKPVASARCSWQARLVYRHIDITTVKRNAPLALTAMSWQL